MEKISKRARDSENEAYTSIVKIRGTIPGAVDEKLYGRLQMAVTLREALEAMERFELRSFIELARGIELEETVRKKIIEDVVKAEKRLRLVYHMIKQEKQQKEKQQALRKKEEGWERKEENEWKNRIEGTHIGGERGPEGRRSDWQQGREKR